MPPPRLTLTPRELAIMNVVWERNGATVREVHTALSAERPVAYTTVMTLMRILETKGYLARREEERAFVYTPTRKRQHVMRAMVRDFVERVFDGAAQSLRVHLVRHEALSDEERAELRRLIDDVPEGS